MTLYARVCDGLTRILGIPELLNEVRDEVAELDEILGRRAEIEERRAQQREEHRDRILSRALAVLAPIVAVLALFGTNLEPFNRPFPVRSRTFWIPAAVAALVILLIWRLLGATSPKRRAGDRETRDPSKNA